MTIDAKIHHMMVLISTIILALQPVDRKKNRKSNLISANIGILILGFMLVNGTIQFNLHILPINLGKGAMQW